MDDLINWSSIHPIAFTVIWLMIGMAGVILIEIFWEKELTWFYRITVLVAWPAYLVVAIFVFILAFFGIL